MTKLEKVKTIYNKSNIIVDHCPSDFGMEDDCEYCNDDYECCNNDCDVCWNREYVEEGNIPAEDPIKPEYYNDSKITPFDVIDDWNLGFYLGNAIKYIKRAGKKKDNSRLQDLKKIREYVDQEIRKEEAR